MADEQVIVEKLIEQTKKKAQAQAGMFDFGSRD
jgi:hypothetical protein